MFKQLKLETKIIIGFMLPVLIVMMTSAMTYFLGKRTQVMNQEFAQRALSFARDFPGIDDADAETEAYIEKYKNDMNQMDCIAIGPTITDPHTFNERLSVDTVKPFYDSLIEIINRIYL